MTNPSTVLYRRAFFARLCVALKSTSGGNLISLLKTSPRSLAWSRCLGSFAAALILLVAVCVPAQAQTLVPNWIQQSPANSPSARFVHSMTYDAAHGQVVLFGGLAGAYLSDTWLWNGTDWTQSTTTSFPSARAESFIAYDAATGNVVLFGGLTTSSLRDGDTWIWNGTTWTQASPANNPGARASGMMVYDAALGKVVLFGGVNASGSDTNDTWEWDGTNWTQIVTAHSPSARAEFGMAYDAVRNQVVLFGGNSNGSYVNDTWVFNGTDWTQLNPATVPPARYTTAMAYDTALGETVMFGGYNGSFLGDTWLWNGTNWTLDSTVTTAPSPRYAANGMVYDAAQGQMILFGGGNGSSDFSDTWAWAPPQNFGSINVCPSGQTTPAPCSNIVSLTYTVASDTNFGAPQILTQGKAGLDFQFPTTGTNNNTCIGAVSAGSTCTINVNFAPLAPGLRTGAVQLFNNVGGLLTTTPIYGIGQGPAVAFGPGTQTTVPTSGLHYNVGLALDGAGDLFIADYTAGKVVKVTPGGVQTTVPATGLIAPVGVAVDGAGDVFIVDLSLPYAVEVTPSGVQTTVGSGLDYPIGIALDGVGDVFIGDQNNNRVVKVTPSGVQTTVPATGLNQVWGVALDAAGDVFISDGVNKRVVEVTPSGVQTTVPATGLSQPYDVAVDAAGDVFIADAPNSRVVEVTPGGAQTTVGSGLNYPSGVAVDAAGDVFIGDQGSGIVFEVNRSQAPSLGFATTNVGFTSSDSPQSITLQNVGNQTLDAVSPGFLVVSGPDFVDVLNSVATPDCLVTSSLIPGADCNLSIGFRPQSAGLLSGSAIFNDNALNATSAQQTIPLSGSAFEPPQTLTLIGAGAGNGSVVANPTGINCNVLAGVASGTCSSSYPGGTGVSLEEIPSSGFVFLGWGGACASAGTSQFCNLTVNTATNVTASFVVAATNYTLQLTEVGTGAGTVNDNQSQISCGLAGGAVTGTCAGTYPNGTPVTLTATATGASTFAGWGGACASAGTNLKCSVVVSGATNVTASFSQQNFGNVNVCPAGQTTPAPCNRNLALTFNMASNTIIGAIQVVTQGATGLDFSLGSGGTCTGTIAAGNSCTVNVSFAPLAPGLRTGAVELFDSSANLLATAPIYGIGQGPVIAFGPGTQTTLNTGSYSLNQPKGVTLDAAGDVFIADTGNQRVVEVAANGTQHTVGVGLNYPQGLAVDGAGDLFIADNNLNEVVEVPAGCAVNSCQKTVGTGLSSQLGVAVDGPGDVFIGDFNGHVVVEVPAHGGPQSVVYNPGTSSNPVGVALDAAGDLFIADFGLQEVVEVPAGCASSSCQITVGSGWSELEGVAVDAAGDVFVTDAGLEEVVEFPAGCTSSGCQSIVASGIVSLGVKVDAAGDVVIADDHNNRVVVVSRSLPPSFNFALTNVGNTSTDSPQLVSVQNVGNQLLTGSLTSSLGANFLESGSCNGGFSLTPGAACSASFSFAPQSTGYFTGSAAFSDDTMNLSALVALQTINLSGNGGLNGQPVGVTVPNVVGLTPTAATTAITGAGLAMGTVSNAASSIVPSGSVIESNPAAGTQVSVGSAVRLLVSNGQAPPPTPNPLSLLNNYFVTGDYASAGVTLRGTGVRGSATGTIIIPDSTTNPGVNQGVPDGADIIDAFLYWETLENTTSPSGASGTFDNYPITGQQIGSDLPYADGAFSGTLRAYRADVNTYLPLGANGVRFGSGSFTVSLPDGGTALPLTEGASLVIIYRVMSPNFPLKSVVIYDGSAIPTVSTNQNMQGFYDSVGTVENTALFAANGVWSNNSSSVAVAGHASQFSAPMNPGNAYAAVILSTPVNNSDNDGITDAWKAGPAPGDFYAGQPGYYDVKTTSWVPLPGAKHGQKDLFVQLDYMCGAVLSDGSCDPSQENLFPSPDAQGNDPLAMVKNAFAADGVVLHLNIGNAVPESMCTDNTSTNPPQLCQFPSEPGVIGWKNSLEFSKLWPRNFASCAAGGDCSTRFPYGQKDSHHYVLFGHSLAIPAWNTRYGTLTSISANNSTGLTTITTTDRGTGINECPGRFTISGVLSSPSLNGVYNTSSCPDSKTIILLTPGVPSWSYNYSTNTPPEPAIGLTSGTVTSISGYSDLGGADSAVTLGLWETAPNQDMSKRSNVIAGTLFHEIGHTLGLTHGGLYYQTPGSYIPTFDVNCKPNYQSVMNYLFQLDGVGPNATVAYSNQTLATLSESSLGSVSQLIDSSANPATFSTSAWYVPYNAQTTTASAATWHCDGTPLNGDTPYYRVDGSVTTSPGWVSGQNITYDGPSSSQLSYSQLLGYNDVSNLDLRQVGATGGEFASLATILSFGSSATPLNIAAGGNVTLGSGGTIALGSGGNVTLGSGGTITPGSSGTVTLGSGGNVTLGSGGTITLGSGGNVTLGSGGNVTLGSGGTITSSAGTVTIPSTGGSYALPNSGGTIALGSGGNVTLGSGGNVTLGSGGVIALGSGGNVTLGSGGNVTLGSGGNITLGSGGTITMGSGGNVTLGSGGTVTLGSGGDVSVGSGGNVTLGSGGTATLGSGGTVTLGSGGNVTLGSGGNVTLGSGGTITMGSGGNVTLGSGGNVTLGSGGTITLGSGGNVTLGSGGNVTLGSGGTITLGSGGTVTIPPGGSYTIPNSGGTITLGSGGNVTLGSGGNVTLGSGGTIALGSGGNVTLGSGGNVTLGSGGTITMGSGGTITLGSGGTVTLGSGGNVTLGSGGVVALGSGGNVTLGSGGLIALGSGGNITLGSGGATTIELTYETANSVVRPPSSPTETPMPAPSGTVVIVNWTAPAFGVVSTYTISRSSDGATPIVIGSVGGVQGNPPATTFTDTNPDLTSQTVVYTISTTLLPVHIDPTQRQSAPSPPAVLTNNQTIVLGTLPSSVTLGSSQPTVVTATAETNGAANGLQVSFSATGSCAVSSQSVNTSGVSSAAVTLNSTGSCTITASQPGTNLSQPGNPPYYNAANSVSGTFMILPQGSNTQSQTILFPQLPNVQYGSTFSLSASSSAGLTVSFKASGPCTTSGSISGVGVCAITASAPANSTYSAASVTQSFTIYPAVLKVTANNVASVYGQPLPPLTYMYSGFVNNESASIISGAPALSTTATAGSNAGSYPITVSTGTLAAANYSFLYVSGTLTISKATATINVTPYSVTYNGSPHTVTGTATGVGSVSLMGLTLNTTHTAAGTYTDTWTFTDTTGNYNNASGNVTDTILPAPLTITANSPLMIYGGPVPPITPIYMGFVNNEHASNLSIQPICATLATSTSPVGTYVSTCSNASASNYSISYAAGSVQVNQASTTIAVTSSSSGNTSTFEQSVTFTATVTPQYGGTTPTGIVTFYNNGSQIGTGTLNLGQATFSISSLPASAADSITAIYSGDSNFMGSTSPAITQTVRATPIVSLNPLFVSFGNQNVHTTSSGIKITLTNVGDAALTPISIGISGDYAGDFTQTNNCPSSLGFTPPSNSCTITVVFTPVDTGALDAVLTITSNDNGSSGSQQYVSLAGGGLSTIVGGSLFSNAIFATALGCDSVVMNGGSTVDSFDSSLGFSSSHLLSGGNVAANGSITLNGHNTAIYGTASVWNQNCQRAPSGFTSNGGGQAIGGVGALSGPGNYPAPPLPYTPPVSTQNISGSCGSIAGCTSTGSKTVTLAPGSYGNLSISGGTTAHLSAGTYNVNSLTLSGNSVLYVDSGPVYVNIAGASLNGGNPAMDMSGGSMQNPTGNPANLQFSYAGSQGANLSGGLSSYATVYAPNAPVNLSGGSDFFGSIIGSLFTNSGGVALHYDRHLGAIKAGNYIWFNAVINNVKGLPSGSNPAQVKLYMTNSTINFTANGTSYSVPVPNAVVTFNSTTALGTTFSTTSNRWSTSIPASDMTGNTFVAGVAFPVPANFPAGIQNVSWSAAFSTDTPGITLQWQWGAAVYTSFSTTYATTGNANALGVNAEDGAADANGKDPAGTPEAYKSGVVFGATGCGSTDFAGHLTSGAGVVPSLAPVSVSPSSLDFGTQAQGTKTATPLTAILTNNDSAFYTISSITITGTNAGDFALTNKCPASPNTFASGASCMIGVTFTPSDVGTRTAKVIINDGATNSPQTVYLSGTGH